MLKLLGICACVCARARAHTKQ